MPKVMELSRKCWMLDITEKYPNLKVEVTFCKNRAEVISVAESLHSIWQANKALSIPGAFFCGFKKMDDDYNPLGLLCLLKNVDSATLAHEMFHIARNYFQLMGRDINVEGDEPFAHLLSDLIEAFHRAPYKRLERQMHFRP